MHEREVMRKLRAVAVMAYTKIWANRFKGGIKQPVPGKWPEEAFDAEGERDWLKCPVHTLFDKLDEECAELRREVVEPSRPGTGKLDLFKEAGDVTALAMFLADWSEVFETVPEAVVPRVVCLVGSTRFRDEFLQAQYEETMRGNIVLTVGFWHHAEAGKTRSSLSPSKKAMLDQLHLRKIDLSDDILVVNIGGHIGESTKKEIQYAQDTGKLVRYYESPESPA